MAQRKLSCDYTMKNAKKIEIGDIIRFTTENWDSCYRQVSALYRAKSFEELFEDFDISILADKSMTKEELLKELGKFYTKEKQEKYGVVGIRVDRVKCPLCHDKLALWIFGEPTYEAFLKAEKHEYILGGCLVSGDDPCWHCYGCNHDFTDNLTDLGEGPKDFEE